MLDYWDEYLIEGDLEGDGIILHMTIYMRLLNYSRDYLERTMKHAEYWQHASSRFISSKRFTSIIQAASFCGMNALTLYKKVG